MDRIDAQHCDGVAGSVTAISPGRPTLVAMVQTADLREGCNVAGRGLSLLKIPSGHRLGLPMKATDEGHC